jgi:hypothetical protein
LWPFIFGSEWTYVEAAVTAGYELSVMEAHARAGLPFP